MLCKVRRSIIKVFLHDLGFIIILSLQGKTVGIKRGTDSL